ncbi:MAG: hypothetical protein U0W24_11815 [Bacteroidales bacterium]
MIFVVEGEVDFENQTLFNQHIEVCESCRKLFIRFKSDMERLNQVQVTEPNPFFASRVLSTLENRERMLSEKSWWRKREYALQLAFYCIIVLVSLIFGHYLGNNKIEVDKEIVKQNTELTDMQLFAESYQIYSGNENDYGINSENGE